MNRALLRFCLVGAVNTLIDISILFILHDAFNVPIVLANIVSTSSALVVSYMLNSRFVFEVSSITAARRVAFVVVTLVGLWAMQPLIILFVRHLFDQYHLTDGLVRVIKHQATVNLLIPKLFAVAATLVWNFIWYKKVIFRQSPRDDVSSAT